MLVPKSGRDESQDCAREGSTDEGRGRRDVAHAVGSVGERHVRADLAACVWAAWKEVSVGVRHGRSGDLPDETSCCLTLGARTVGNST